ncbi:MAG TPA: hypothetical protein VF531_06805 [Bacillota bacterium]
MMERMFYCVNHKSGGGFPGFRSRVWWKKVFAVVIYLFIFINITVISVNYFIRSIH